MTPKHKQLPFLFMRGMKVAAVTGQGGYNPDKHFHLQDQEAGSIGHFTSLFKRSKQQFHTLIVSEPLPETILGMPIETITATDYAAQLSSWLKNLPSADTTFYVAGNIPLVVKTRKILKDAGWKQIKSAGFWE
jgi:hypothetical protein